MRDKHKKETLFPAMNVNELRLHPTQDDLIILISQRYGTINEANFKGVYDVVQNETA